MLPRHDPFYRAPWGFELTEPGTVLRSREVEIGFLGVIPNPVRAVQLAFRTVDFAGEPMVGVTTVLVPTDREPGAAGPVVSYQCAIDAVADKCFPSYALRMRSFAPGALPQFEFLLIAALLAEGWIVSVPDHEGPQGLWGIPREPGYIALDGVRAAIDHTPLGIAADAPVGLWGYSGGGLATAWAAEMYAEHAPELNVVGAALGSPVGDLGKTFIRLNGTFFSALPALVVSALRHIYPDLDRVLSSYATPEGTAKLSKLNSMTTAEAVVRFMFTDMDTLVERPLDEILALPEVQAVFDEIRLGQFAPAMPVLILQAVHDRIVDVDDIDTLVATYTAGGTDVTYHRDAFNEHMLMHPMSAPTTLRWLRDRFEGRPVDENRRRTTWPTLLNPSTFVGMLRLGAISARVMAGKAVARQKLSTLDR